MTIGDAVTPTADKRVQFDFEVDFSNGGGIQGQDFRLDIEEDYISDQELADYIVKDLRLLMVGSLRILNKQIISERHKRNTTLTTDTSGVTSTALHFIDLSHTIVNGMVTYKGLPAPIICDFIGREASKELYTEGTTFQIDKLEMVGNTGTYLDSPFHRFADGQDLSELDLARLADLDAVVIRVTGLDGRAVG